MSTLFSDLFNGGSSEEELFASAGVEYPQMFEKTLKTETKSNLAQNISSTDKLNQKKGLGYKFVAQGYSYAWSDLLRSYDVQKDGANVSIVSEYQISLELYLAYIHKIKNYFDDSTSLESATGGIQLLDHLIKCRVQLSNQKETEHNMQIYDWVVYFTLKYSRLKNLQKLGIIYINRLLSENRVRVIINNNLKSKS